MLELAAGVGDTGFEATQILGADGRLICGDLSPAMVDAARRRGRELGLDNVDYRVVDAERIDLDDDAVDGVLCRFGYMLMGDRGAALSETRRVLRRGGRLVLTVGAPPERNPFFALVAMNLIRRGDMTAPDPERPGIVSMADKKRTTALLEAAGFDEVRLEEVPGRFAFEDVDEYLGFVADTAGPLAAALRGLPDEERTATKAGARGGVRAVRDRRRLRAARRHPRRGGALTTHDDHRRRGKRHGNESASGEGAVGARGAPPAHGR